MCAISKPIRNKPCLSNLSSDTGEVDNKPQNTSASLCCNNDYSQTRTEEVKNKTSAS